jgi:hypothetical protein
MEASPVKVTLEVGHTDKGEVNHKDVTIGSLLKGGDLFLIEMNMRYRNEKGETLFNVLALERAITKFGDLPIPVSRGVLLDLDSIDLEDLVEAYNNFVGQHGEPQPLSSNSLKLVYGYEVNGDVFDVVEFGRVLTGRDVVDAEKSERESASRMRCFLAGREIVRLRQSNGEKVVEGLLDVRAFDDLAGIDVLAILSHSELWMLSVRAERLAQRQANNPTAAQ